VCMAISGTPRWLCRSSFFSKPPDRAFVGELLSHERTCPVPPNVDEPPSRNSKSDPHLLTSLRGGAEILWCADCFFSFLPSGLEGGVSCPAFRRVPVWTSTEIFLRGFLLRQALICGSFSNRPLFPSGRSCALHGGDPFSPPNALPFPVFFVTSVRRLLLSFGRISHNFVVLCLYASGLLERGPDRA